MTDAPETITLPPSTIADAPFRLDDVDFLPNEARRIEHAERAGHYIGDVLLDDNRFWFARKPDVHGEMSDWKPMRCLAEARAFIVSKIRQ